MTQEGSGTIGRGESVLSGLEPNWPTTASECLRRAKTCNRLAKLVTGHTRQVLYRLKNLNIRAAEQLAPAALLVRVDHDLHVGLLSVSLRDDPSVCVHTHENWVNAA